MKSYRVYFNRQMDWPMIWCVDEGSIHSQIRCPHVILSGVHATGNTVLAPKKVKLVPNEPIAWIDVYAKLRLDGGTVIFEKDSE